MPAEKQNRRNGDEVSVGEIVRIIQDMKSEAKDSSEKLRADLHESLQDIRMQYANFVMLVQYNADQKAIKENLGSMGANLQRFEDRIRTNFQLALASLVFPVLVGIIIVIIRQSIGQP